MVALFIPGEFALDLGGLRLEIYRFILGISLISGVLRLSKQPGKMELADRLMLFVATIGFISLLRNHGLGEGIEKGGIFLFEILGAYFLSRFGITNQVQLIKVYKILITMVLLFLIPTLIEMTTGYKVIHELAKSVTGRIELGPALYSEKYMRMGMTRSTSAFSHPILNGAICVAAVPMAFYLLIRRFSVFSLFALVGVIASVVSALSSAPLLVLMVNIAFGMYVKLKQIIKSNIKYVMWFVIITAVVLQFSSNRGIIKLIIQTMTFNPETGTHRLLIIANLEDDIMRHPILGSGIGAYWSAPGWMGQSIDNFWWAIAFTYGIPYSVILAITGLSCFIRIKVNDVPTKDDYLAYAIKACILSLMIVGLTVHFFGKAHPLFFFTLGTSVFLFQQQNQQSTQRTRRPRTIKYNDGSNVADKQ